MSMPPLLLPLAISLKGYTYIPRSFTVPPSRQCCSKCPSPCNITGVNIHLPLLLANKVSGTISPSLIPGVHTCHLHSLDTQWPGCPSPCINYRGSQIAPSFPCLQLLVYRTLNPACIMGVHTLPLFSIPQQYLQLSIFIFNPPPTNLPYASNYQCSPMCPLPL